MQAVLTESGLYGELKELEDAIAEYRKVKGENRARESELRKQIISLLQKTRLFDEIKNELRRKVGERCGKVCENDEDFGCLLYTSPSPRDRQKSRMPSSA